jgi:hypothetical protein
MTASSELSNTRLYRQLRRQPCAVLYRLRIARRGSQRDRREVVVLAFALDIS